MILNERSEGNEGAVWIHQAVGKANEVGAGVGRLLGMFKQ